MSTIELEKVSKDSGTDMPLMWHIVDRHRETHAICGYKLTGKSQDLDLTTIDCIVCAELYGLSV